ncbi:F-box only protein 40 [Callorhinchus milii]|uniref:F-box only protein 40 n=1 Tax=Callorhinchus milii TaxID=7868 RepID=UPI001C3F9AEE|nr:F-box only protein 40 [Callorhinchus milii]
MSINRNLNHTSHRHCETCFNRYCRKSFEHAVSCLVVDCSSKCGATFHLCKEEEHKLLCPREHVPCLNSAYGCPFFMARSKLGKHLHICPASVVACSMEWNRWPVSESHKTLQKNILKEPTNLENLATAMAMRDQRILFNSIKMAELFPEMTERDEENDLDLSEVGAVGGQSGASALDPHLLETGTQESDEDKEEVVDLTDEERKALAKDKSVVCNDLNRYDVWEKIFSKEKRSCKITEANSLKVKTKQPSSSTDNKKERCENKSNSPDLPSLVKAERKGGAPWNEGVLDRLSSQLDSRSFTMYLLHHGRMLIRFGQMSACTPKEKDFVYGNLEPQIVRTVNTFKVPISYHTKRNQMLGVMKRKVENKAVDTSDLETEMQQNDEVSVSMLCSLEGMLKGHIISETKATDGCFVDIGTQAYSFPSAPFRQDVVLADVAAERSSSLHLELQTECITRRYNRLSSTFKFTCQQFFRRDEFSSHFKNVHTDIQSSLNGWMEQRCPLAYLGCPYSQQRFCPSRPKAKVVYNHDQSTFAIRPYISPVLHRSCEEKLNVSKRSKKMDALSSLPSEIVRHIACFLDSYSLSQFSQVSVLMNDVCTTLLSQRGMVSLVWEKKSYSAGSFSWRARKRRWQFSSVFSTIDHWRFADIPSMGEHLKSCLYYMTECRSTPVPLTSMCMTEGQKQEKNTLVETLKRKKISRLSSLTI